MNVLRALLSGSCSLLAACGGHHALPGDASSPYRLAAQFRGAETGGEQCLAELRQLGAQALVFAHSERSAGRHDGRMVLIADDPPEAALAGHGKQTAVVVTQTGATVAVDMALLWCHGITPPRRLAIGTRVHMPDGTTTTQPAPGDFVIQLQRREHADVLTTTPQTDVVFHIGIVLQRAEGRHLRARDEAVEAAKRYPQLDLVARCAEGDPALLEVNVRELLAQGHRAILVSTDDPDALGPIAAAAQERNVALIVLDPNVDWRAATCCVGPDQRTLGRAAGETVKVMAPSGAAIVELADELESASAQQRHQGFCDALGLPHKP